jgi:hypothetical protein
MTVTTLSAEHGHVCRDALELVPYVFVTGETEIAQLPVEQGGVLGRVRVVAIGTGAGLESGVNVFLGTEALDLGMTLVADRGLVDHDAFGAGPTRPREAEARRKRDRAQCHGPSPCPSG